MTYTRKKSGIVYALVDPRTNQVRYVGQTIKSRRERLLIHLRAARRNEHTHCARWLRTIIADGAEPEALVLARVARANLNAVEKAWIKVGAKLGWPLTNMTPGGGGGRLAHPDAVNPMTIPSVVKKVRRSLKGRRLGPEHRASLVEAQRKRRDEERRNGGVSDEFRERCRRVNLGRRASARQRRNMRKAQKRRFARGYPDEHREKLRKAQRARRARERATGTGCASEEFLQNCSRAQRGRKVTKTARKNMGEAQKKRFAKGVPAEHRKNISAAQKARGAQISARMKAAWADPEKRARMMRGRGGRKASEQARANMRKAQRARRASERARDEDSSASGGDG